MTSYHQIGHHSKNLIFENYLSDFQGAILSPVNYTKRKTEEIVSDVRETFSDFDLVFDPQLYYPRTGREKLLQWEYYPNDVETADISNIGWWRDINRLLVENIEGIEPKTICSPANHPRNFDNDYYDQMNHVASDLKEKIDPVNVRVLQTVLVSLSDLASYSRVMEISSIISRTESDGIYLIFYSDKNPRRELDDPEELKGGMVLINNLANNSIDVLVGYSSSDFILWKVSGAKSCATGKFFNLRRFTSSRWDVDLPGGGGQLPYLFEHKLLANLRESDISRVRRANLISNRTKNNPYFNEIMQNITSGEPWLGLGWRFYMFWFSQLERDLENGSVSGEDLIRKADNAWGQIEEDDIILEERQNDGNWIREWLRAVLEYEEPWD